jgi:hypothetical protein
MTALPEGAALLQVPAPTDPSTVFRKTIEVAVHPVEEVAVLAVGGGMDTKEVQAIVPMIKVLRKATLLLTTAATITGLKIPFIKMHLTHLRLLNMEAHQVHQTAIIRVLAILKVRLKIETRITCRATHREASAGFT